MKKLIIAILGFSVISGSVFAETVYSTTLTNKISFTVSRNTYSMSLNSDSGFNIFCRRGMLGVTDLATLVLYQNAGKDLSNINFSSYQIAGEFVPSSFDSCLAMSTVLSSASATNPVRLEVQKNGVFTVIQANVINQ